jgi:hypothetical protein
MPIRNTAVIVYILAWNTDTQIGQINDQANITIRGIGDGAEYTPGAPAITQIDAVRLMGIYSISVAAAENNYNINTIGGISTTANVVIVPFSWANDQVDFNTTKKASIGSAVLDADLQLHLGAGVGFRNIGNILGALAQSEFEQRTNVFAVGAVVAQGITAAMAAQGCIQYQTVALSYTKNFAAPDRIYYLLFHYNILRQNDIVKASLLPVW